MFFVTHRHSNLIIFLTIQQTQALLISIVIIIIIIIIVVIIIMVDAVISVSYTSTTALLTDLGAFPEYTSLCQREALLTVFCNCG